MVKKYIKNITDDKSFGYKPMTGSFKENGKKIILKPGEQAETKLNGDSIDGHRFKLVTEKGEIYGRGPNAIYEKGSYLGLEKKEESKKKKEVN